MQRSSSDNSAFINSLTQFKSQDVQNYLNRNQNNAENDTFETFQNKGNLSIKQKEALN